MLNRKMIVEFFTILRVYHLDKLEKSNEKYSKRIF